MYLEEIGHIWKEYYNDFTRECDTHLIQRMKEFYDNFKMFYNNSINDIVTSKKWIGKELILEEER